jgi:hypothetical protein
MNEEEREDELYAAYAASIEVPEMWSGLEARLRQRTSRARWVALAAAAMIAAIAIGIVSLRRDPLPAIAGPAGEASTHYRAAIARLERTVPTAAPPELTNAVHAAEIAASQAPSDPVVVTRLMSAYDAKLATLRGAARVQ